MLGVGTLFRYKYAHTCENHITKYGVVTERHKQAGSIAIQWTHGGEPYGIFESDLIAMLKSGDKTSGIIFNPNESVNCN